MKKIIFFSLSILLSGLAQAQEETSDLERKSMVKLNVIPLTIGSFSADYEYLISTRTTIGTNLTFMPKRSIPMLGSFESTIDDEAVSNQLENAKIGTFSISPQAKFYLGKDVYRGFYIAPFFRYASHSIQLPVNYYYNGQNETVVIDGKINTFSGGIAFGAQWKLSEKFYLDWTIIGPLYGSHNGTLSGNKNLNQEEITEIENALNDFDEIPFIKHSHEVNSQGVKVKTKGPWAGLRIGISVGYRF